MSFGPCQTPTLWFCVQRHKEISNFRPEEYFIVRVRATLGGREVDLTWADGDRVTRRDEVGKMEEAVRKASTQQSATIVRLEEEVKRQRRPQALNTVTLLKAASKGLGMSPTAAMSAAESLYTSGYISSLTKIYSPNSPPGTSPTREPRPLPTLPPLICTPSWWSRWGNVSNIF